jgi:ribose-phosphate pyrophosphokinase
MKIFSGIASEELAKKIAKELKTKLGRLENYTFPDGEKRIRVVDKVVDQDCVVVQSTSTPADKNYMELFFIVDALKRNGAKKVTAVVPYLGYQRQDHIFRDGEAVSLEVVIKTLEAVGMDSIITFDLHSIKIPEIFRIPVVHLSALSLFAEKIKKISNFVLVSPDMGGIRRIKQLSEMLGSMPYAAIEKNRDLKSGKIEASQVHGDIKKRAIIVDDMISTGSTIVVAADLLMKKGAEEVYVFATHPVFSKDAHVVLQKSKVKKVFVTDTIEVPKEKQFAKLEVISVARMIATSLSS